MNFFEKVKRVGILGWTNFCVKMGWLPMSIELLEKAIATQPPEKAFYFALSNCYLIANKKDAAIHALRAALDVWPDDLWIRFRVGALAIALQRPQLALEHLEFCTSHWDSSKGEGAAAYALLGGCYVILKQWSKAEEKLTQAIEVTPWDLDACVSLYNLYMYTGRLEKAPEVLSQYIEKYPKLYPPYLWMAHHLQYVSRRPLDSLEWYRKALSKIGDTKNRKYSEQYESAHGLLDILLEEYIDALFVTGESNLVLSEIKKYRKYRFGDPIEGKRRLISFYVRTNDLERAEQIANGVLRFRKNSHEILTCLAQIRLKKGQLDDAEKFSQQALEIYEEYTDALEIQAEIRVIKKDWAGAMKIYQKLVSLNPFAPDWLRGLGLSYLRTNHVENACEQYEECVKYNPAEAEAWVELGDVYVMLNRRQSALSAYQQALQYTWLRDEKRQIAVRGIEQIKGV